MHYSTNASIITYPYPISAITFLYAYLLKTRIPYITQQEEKIMMTKKRILSVAIITIIVLATLSMCVTEKTKGVTGPANQDTRILSKIPNPIKQQSHDTKNNDNETVMGAEVNLEWTDDEHNKGNVTFSDAMGYYEMNTANGTATITAGYAYIQRTEILYVENISNTVTINPPPYTYWDNITLPAIPKNTATLIGNVYDKNTNNPLQANISIVFTNNTFMGSNTTTTNNQGYYKIHLPAAEVTATASAIGYYPADNTTIIGDTETIDFFLEPEPPETAMLQGYITNKDTSAGIHNAALAITGVNSSYFNYTQTDTTGYYECNLPSGDFNIIAVAENYFTYFILTSVRLNTSEVKWINMSLVPYPFDNAWVSGYVYDDTTGSPLPNAQVTVSGMTTIGMIIFGSFSRNTTTDVTGYYNVSIPAITAIEVFPGYYTNITRITSISGSADTYFSNDSMGGIIEPGDSMSRDVILEPEPPEICIIKGYIYHGDTPPVNQPPTCSLSASPSMGTAPLTVEFSMTTTDYDGVITNWTLDIDDDGIPEYTGTGIPPATQEHTYTVNGTYIAILTVTDNTGATGNDTITIMVSSSGNQSPMCTLSADPTTGFIPLTVNFTMTASDPDGTIAAWSLDVNTDGTTEYTGLGDPPSTQQHVYTIPGIYTATLTVTDNEGATNQDIVDNISAVSTDNTPPITTSDINPVVPNGKNNWYISNVTVTLTATDNHSEINATYYRINEDTWFTYTNPFNISQNGEHTVYFYSVDMQGNEEEEKSFSIKIDKSPPETTCSLTPYSPNGKKGWYTKNVQVMLSVSDGGISGINGTWYRIDGTVWQRYMGLLTLQDDGIHTLEYFSEDIAGNNETPDQVQIKIDKTQPSVSLQKPKEKTLYVLDREIIRLPFYTLILGKITIEPQASDIGSGIEKIEFFVDGELQYTDIIPPHEWVYDEPAILFHRHTLKLKAYDAAGHSDETGEYNIWIFNF